jgi:hypothetical protein
MTPIQFVSELASVRFVDAFNPYSDRCPIHDLDDAPARRSELLAQILEVAASAPVDAIWVGRDLGFRGGRRTGMALTDDVHFHDHLARWGISRSRPTAGAAVSERTATVIWEMLERIEMPVFLWNVFPLHPHVTDDPFTNRAHIAKERKTGTEILEQLIQMLRPKRLIAVGNDADKVLHKVAGGGCVVKVRHPSYGGQVEFAQQIRGLYNVRIPTLL